MNSKFILESLIKFGGDAGDFVTYILDSYSRSRKNLWRSSRYNATYQPISFSSEDLRRQRIYNIMYVLKKQGFIEKKNFKGNFLWKITSLGQKKLHLLRNKRFLFDISFSPKPAQETTIIIFDIPERLAYLRRWLRINLVALGFEKLQKSVWIGKVQLPNNFLKEITRYRLEQYIHIFKVTKSGTL